MEEVGGEQETRAINGAMCRGPMPNRSANQYETSGPVESDAGSLQEIREREQPQVPVFLVAHDSLCGGIVRRIERDVAVFCHRDQGEADQREDQRYREDRAIGLIDGNVGRHQSRHDGAGGARCHAEESQRRVRGKDPRTHARVQSLRQPGLLESREGARRAVGAASERADDGGSPEDRCVGRHHRRRAGQCEHCVAAQEKALAPDAVARDRAATS